MRIAVLGTGSAGMRHLRTLAALPGVATFAVPLRDSRVRELREQGFDASSNLDEVLARGVDGAIVATDTARHAQDAVRCLQHCPVLVEKPAARTSAEAAWISEASRKSGRPVHVAFCLRFDQGLKWVRRHLPSLGPVALADVECLSWLPSWRPQRNYLDSYSARPGEGGVLLDLSHELDYSTWLFDRAIEVQARFWNAGVIGLPHGVEETALVLARHASGTEVSLRISYAVRPSSRRLRAWGRDGTIEWDGLSRRVRRWDASGILADEMEWAGPEEMLRDQMTAWLDALAGTSTGDLVGIDEATHIAVLCDAAKDSAKRRCSVAVPGVAIAEATGR